MSQTAVRIVVQVPVRHRQQCGQHQKHLRTGTARTALTVCTAQRHAELATSRTELCPQCLSRVLRGWQDSLRQVKLAEVMHA